MSNEHIGLKEYLDDEWPTAKVRFFITDSPSDYVDFKCSECGENCFVKFYGNINDASFCEIQIECKNCDNKLEFPYKCSTLEDFSKE